jgi:hypothetical protein
MLNQDISAFPLTAEKSRNAFMHRATIQFQPKSDTGYLFERNVRKFFYYFGQCIKMMLRLLFRYGKAQRSFKRNKEYLTSRKFWNQYLEI